MDNDLTAAVHAEVPWLGQPTRFTDPLGSEAGMPESVTLYWEIRQPERVAVNITYKVSGSPEETSGLLKSMAFTTSVPGSVAEGVGDEARWLGPTRPDPASRRTVALRIGRVVVRIGAPGGWIDRIVARILPLVRAQEAELSRQQ